MLYPHKKLDEIVTEMKSFGEFLMPYNAPQVSQAEEDEVNYIKTRDVHVDGYNLMLHYSKADHTNYYLETLQILSKYCPFVPFHLVCKIGRRFLGEDYLSLVEAFKDNRKIYCWTKITDREGNAMPGPFPPDVGQCIYEGFIYRLMDPKVVNFY